MESKPTGLTKNLTVGSILVSAITIGFTGLATIIAQAVAILAFVAFLTLVVIHRREWFVWLREVRGQGKLLPLIGMAVFAVGFIGCFTWWSLLPRAPSSPEKKMIPVEMADAQSKSDVAHENLQEKLKDAATEPTVVTNSSVTATAVSKPVASLSLEVTRAAKPPSDTEDAAKIEAPTQTSSRRLFYKSHMQKQYAEGRKHYDDMRRAQTDAEYRNAQIKADDWYRGTQNWTRENMGQSAFEHVKDLRHNAASYSWPGEHDPEVRAERDIVLGNFGVILDRIQEFITTDAWDPSEEKR